MLALQIYYIKDCSLSLLRMSSINDPNFHVIRHAHVMALQGGSLRLGRWWMLQFQFRGRETYVLDEIVPKLRISLCNAKHPYSESVFVWIEMMIEWIGDLPSTPGVSWRHWHDGLNERWWRMNGDGLRILAANFDYDQLGRIRSKATDPMISQNWNKTINEHRRLTTTRKAQQLNAFFERQQG